MPPILDTQRLNLVFQARPDILSGIQKAAGKLRLLAVLWRFKRDKPFPHSLPHSISASRNNQLIPMLSSRFPGENKPVQRHRKLRVRPTVHSLHRRALGEATQSRSQRGEWPLDTTVPEWSPSRCGILGALSSLGTCPSRNKRHFGNSASAQEIQPVLHREFSLREDQRVGSSCARHCVRLERHWYGHIQ